MAQCIQINQDGTITALSVPPAQCQSYLLMDSTDYANVMAAGNIWAADQNQIEQGFGWGFGLVMTCYLVAYGYGAIISFLPSK
ncbi:hypothetical protein [Aquitalea aquatilis]|uniref:hypothetical protein n=1 Tax=Aquitalea aquatilis TaxID=1537400 RepID=UPI0010BCF7F5|nr:hypothetical protein [Aquitalea aquatilis]